jgi:hypothetical protein
VLDTLRLSKEFGGCTRHARIPAFREVDAVTRQVHRDLSKLPCIAARISNAYQTLLMHCCEHHARLPGSEGIISRPRSRKSPVNTYFGLLTKDYRRYENPMKVRWPDRMLTSTAQHTRHKSGRSWLHRKGCSWSQKQEIVSFRTVAALSVPRLSSHALR